MGQLRNTYKILFRNLNETTGGIKCREEDNIKVY
jgi:hypothetical protein